MSKIVVLLNFYKLIDISSKNKPIELTWKEKYLNKNKKCASSFASWSIWNLLANFYKNLTTFDNYSFIF